MKINRIFLSAPFFLMPILAISSCSVFRNENNNNQNANENSNNQVKELKFDNYFKKKGNSQDEKRIKKEIKKILEDYRLYEWLDYYEKKGLSKILKVNGIDYAFSTNINGLSKPPVTEKYKNQDKQFQYFNDFINMFTFDENDKEQKSFHILRYELLSLEASNKLDKEIINGIKIEDINITNGWGPAASEAILSAGTKLDKLIQLGEGFFKAYVNILSKPRLAAIDIWMRFENKNNKHIDYKEWELKRNRASKILEASNDFWLLFEDSFTGDFDGGEETEEITKILDHVKSLFETAKKTMLALITINETDYYNKGRESEE